MLAALQGIPPAKHIQVYNKIDKVSLEERTRLGQLGLVLSCSSGEGLEGVLACLEERGRAAVGVSRYRLRYCLTKHENRKQWLLKVGHAFPYD